MEERNDGDYKVDDVMLPGFRFHPTDEELVGFYLRRKIQQRYLPIELIKQVDIYKYDPWDLPKLASTGEKECYFYCPRDRKYRNSARPNRMTGAGFWKATGIDRPIYSSEGSKCIGLKKSLVFYRGRAAKGIKTDWMMHEFRLPSLADPKPPKKLLDKSYPANDAWAICRIFKKTNSMAQRALSQSWISSLPEATPSDHIHIPQFTSKNTFCNNDLQHNSTVSINIPSYEHQNPKPYPISNLDIPFVFSPLEMSGTGTTNPYSSMFSNQHALIGDISKTCHDSIGFEGSQEQFSGFSISLPLEMQQQDDGLRKNSSDTPQALRSIGFPFSLAPDLPDAWTHNLIWDSDSPQCPSELSTNKCYS